MNTFISAITGIGGHYLNGRWDRAVFFLFFFIIFWILNVLIISLSFYFMDYITINYMSVDYMSQEESVRYMEKVSKVTSIISPIVIAILWISSVVLTFKDSKKEVSWSKLGIVGAVGTSLMSTVVIWSTSFGIWHHFSGNSMMQTSYVENEDNALVYTTNNNFYKYIFFGGGVTSSENLPEPPKGEMLLRGKFTYLGKPAQGVFLSVILNAKYKAKNLKTNEEGEFTIKLSQGNWTINTIQTTDWENKPKDANFFIYSNDERKLIDGNFYEYSHMHKKGLKVDVDNDNSNIHVHITIKPSIKVDWPKEEVEKATIEDAIEWDKYPKAESYYVKINKVTKNGKYTNYSPIIEKTITGATSLPLSSLPFVKTDDDKDNKYNVKIFAFSKNGMLLGESKDSYDGGTFILTDGNVLIEDNMKNILSSSKTNDPKEIEKELKSSRANQKRIKAVKVLIDNKMLEEASSLLNLVEAKYSKGDKEVLVGYVAALQGKCKFANKMFDRAMDIDSKVCLPDKYRVECK